MSWPQWPVTTPTAATAAAAAAAMPGVTSSLLNPLINPAPPVMPTSNQYTQEQWAQMQQQNWQQWAQWQQQYQQWHQQYGAQFQKSMSAMNPGYATPTQAMPVQANMAPLPNMGVPPPPPVETKPPPPPEPPAEPSATMATTYTAQSGYGSMAAYNTAVAPLYGGVPPVQAAPIQVPVQAPMQAPMQPAQPQAQPWPNTVAQPQGNKRSYGGEDMNDAKRQMTSQGQYNQPPPAQSGQGDGQWNKPPPPVPKPNIEELSEAEKRFDKQFAEWEAQFNKWKDQNANHPDKEQYREYEKKWENWRNQLLERREQMRRKRLGITASGKQVSSAPPTSTLQPNKQPNNFAQPPPPPPNQQAPGQPYPAAPGAGLAPPPTAFMDVKDNDPSSFIKPDENAGGDFLKTSSSGGIPGLDLVKDDNQHQPQSNKDDVIELDKDPEKRGPDLDALSKGISNILGDQKILNMLSMVNQNAPANTNAVNTPPRLGDNAPLPPPPPVGAHPYSGDHSSQSFDERHPPEELAGQPPRDFVNNFDDQTRSSFTTGINEQDSFNQGNFPRNRFDGNDQFKRFGNFDRPPMNQQNKFSGPPPGYGQRPGPDFGGPLGNDFSGPPPGYGDRSGPAVGKDFNDRPPLGRDFNDRPGPGRDFGDRAPPGREFKDNSGSGRDYNDYSGTGRNLNDRFGSGQDFSNRPAPGGRGFNDQPGRDFGDEPGRDFGDQPGRDFGDRSGTGRGFNDRPGLARDFNGRPGPGRDYDDDGPALGNDFNDRPGLGRGFNDGPGSGRDFNNRPGSGRDFNDMPSSGRDFNDRPGSGRDFNDRPSLGRDFNDRAGPGRDFNDRLAPSRDINDRPGFGRGLTNRANFGRGIGDRSGIGRGFNDQSGLGKDFNDRRGSSFDAPGRDFGDTSFGSNQDQSVRGYNDDGQFNRSFGRSGSFTDRQSLDRDDDRFSNRDFGPTDMQGRPPVGGYSDREREWDNDNFDDNVDAPDDVAPPPPPIEETKKDDGVLNITDVIDYDHKPLKTDADLDVLVEPFHMYDYRHKQLSRIPIPQRPRWLMESVKHIIQFEPLPVIPRQLDFPPYNRYDTKLDSWKADDYRRRFDGHDKYEDRDRFDRDIRDDRDRDRDRDRDMNTWDRDRGERDRRSWGNRDMDRGNRDMDRGNRDMDRGNRDMDRGNRDMDRGNRDMDRNRDSDRNSNDRDRFHDDRGRNGRGRDDRWPRDDNRDSRGREDSKGRDRDRSRERERSKGREGSHNRDREDRYNDRRDRDRKSSDRRYDDTPNNGRDTDSWRNENDKSSRDKRDQSDGRDDHRDNDRFEDWDNSQPGSDWEANDEPRGESRDEGNTGLEKQMIDPPTKAYSNTTLIQDLLYPPGRYNRPARIVIILRGPPGSGKTFLAKLIKDKEVENGGSAPRILCLDDYFMVEQEKEVVEDGKKVKVKEMVYEYEECMEESYRTSLSKSFKKTITDGYFPFIIVDNVNDKVKYFGEMWSFAKQNGFQVYICQLDLDVQLCSKRNIHNRSEEDIKKCVDGWEPTPTHHPILDATALVQSGSITEVEMEEINCPVDDNEALKVEDEARSKWDTFDCSIDNLAKLDGVSKPIRPSRTMEEYLQLDEWTPSKPTKPGQKRVRWADLEECKQQEKMRAIGFVVGQTNWGRMMDPTKGGSALTQTMYID